jgi:hypothetical protein
MKLVLGLLVLTASLQAVTLVDHGKSTYSICLSASASPSERHGAQELQRFVEEMSGAKLPIVEDSANPTGHLVLLGESTVLRRLAPDIDYPSLGAEGFVLRTAGANVIVAGGRQRGTMYGVYTLLDKLGCRWFTPQISRIPHRTTIRIADLSETHQPSFEYREPYFTEAFDRDWAARNRTNGNSSRLDASTGGKMLYHHFVHSFYELLPPEKYFHDHPEYYSLIDGKRRTDRSQLCLTNPDVLRLTIERVREWIKEEPNAAIYSVSQNDWEGWCECDRCRKVEEEEGGQHSGPILRFVNAVAAEIEKTNPDKLIDTLAYWYTEHPPAHVRPRANVRIRLCPIGICNSHSFGTCPRSAYFAKNLKDWSKITDQLYIWHYNTNFAHYLAPFPDFDELALDIPLYQRSGVKGLFMEGGYAKGGGAENAELRSYVMARLMWDTHTDVNRDVDDFMAGVYGPAAKPMREYYDLLHREVREAPKGGGLHLWIYDIPDFSDGFPARAHALFRAAETAAAKDPAALERVRKARLSLDYFDAIKALRFEVRDGAYGPADPVAARKMIENFLRDARHFGVQEISEGGPGGEWEKVLPRIRAYPVRTLENAEWRVDVVPEFDGRVVRLVNKRLGRELLRQPALGENRGIPNAGGVAVEVHSEPHAQPWGVAWAAEPSSDPRALTLTGTLANGLRLRRTLRLGESGVRVETTVENTAAAPVEFVLYNTADFAAPEIDTAAIRFRNLEGRPVEQQLLAPDDPPSGSSSWTPQEPPDGLVSLSVARGVSVWYRFDVAQTGRAVVRWNAKAHPRVVLGAWSSPQALAPGASFHTETEYGVNR